ATTIFAYRRFFDRLPTSRFLLFRPAARASSLDRHDRPRCSLRRAGRPKQRATLCSRARPHGWYASPGRRLPQRPMERGGGRCIVDRGPAPHHPLEVIPDSARDENRRADRYPLVRHVTSWEGEAEMLVGSVMSVRVVTAGRDETVHAAIVRMTEAGIGS